MLSRFALWLVLAPALAAQGGGTVEGTVVDSVANRGIPGVTVDLTADGSKAVARSAITDAAGAFRISGLAPGDYAASFAKPGFSEAFSLNGRGKIHLAADGDTERLTAKLTELGGVSGRVLDGDGQPFARLRVQLTTASETSNMVLLNSTETDQDGRYRFERMWPGVYLIEARPIEGKLKGAVSGAKSGKEEEKKPPLRSPPSPEGERWAWVNTFYPGVAERSQANRVHLHAGWQLPGYDIRLQAVPVYRVAGVVFGEDGKRAAGVEVAIDAADPFEHDSDGTISHEDGTFEFPSVHQGDWRLTGMRQRGATGLKGFADVMVARHDLENLAIHLAAPFSVSGTVEWGEPGDAKAKPPISTVILETARRGSSATGDTERDGTFRIDNVYPDRYNIPLWGLASGYFAASVLLGDREVLGQPVDFAASPPPLRIILKPATGRVRGTVEDGGQATVVLLPKNEALLSNQFIRSTKCDGEGRYELGGVRPGEYYALAFPGADLFALEDRDFARALNGQAVSVHVDNDLVASVPLKLTPWPE
jgi:protocatechuate 3,4-dioxygenase beta subunit